METSVLSRSRKNPQQGNPLSGVVRSSKRSSILRGIGDLAIGLAFIGAVLIGVDDLFIFRKRW
jgi:hypothetical protein